MTIAIIILSILVFILWVKDYFVSQKIEYINKNYASKKDFGHINEILSIQREKIAKLNQISPSFGALAYINQETILYPIGNDFPLTKNGVYEISKMIVLDGVLIPDGTRVMVLGFSALKVNIFCEQITCNIDINQFRKIVVTREEMDERIREASEAIDGVQEELQALKDLTDHNDYLIKQNEELRSHVQELNRQLAKVSSPKPKKKR